MRRVSQCQFGMSRTNTGKDPFPRYLYVRENHSNSGMRYHEHHSFKRRAASLCIVAVSIHQVSSVGVERREGTLVLNDPRDPVYLIPQSHQEADGRGAQVPRSQMVSHEGPSSGGI